METASGNSKRKQQGEQIGESEGEDMKMNSLQTRVKGQIQEQQPLSTDHSVLAMKAARRMGDSKQKVRTGRTVCRHLLQMIHEADSRQPDPRASRRFHPESTPSALANSELVAAQAVMGHDAANDRQFSLAF